jgi:magnesium chelatase subunit D
MTAVDDQSLADDPGASRYADAMTAATLFAVDPAGTGIVLRGRAGPVLDHWLAAMARLLPEGAPQRRVPPQISDDRLLGGLDLSATLAAGRPVREPGVLGAADGGVVILPMAERMAVETAARIAMVHEAGGLDGRPARFGIVAIDEGAEDDERTPTVLSDRLAFRIDLDGIRSGPPWDLPGADELALVAAARRLLPRVTVPDQWLEALGAATLMLGVHSARAGSLAMRVARCAAALDGEREVGSEHVTAAARLVLAHRATQVPSEEQAQPENAEPESAQPPDRPEASEPSADDPAESDSIDVPDDMMVAEAAAALLPGLLARIAASGGVRPNQSGPSARQRGRSGPKQASATRGRPTRVRAGDPGKGARLDLLATLRAAAPWQTLRQRHGLASDDAPRVAVRRSDFRVKRFEQPVLTTTIFVVDASGSAAMNRLAEAKGAVSLLLADCYVRRDQVALIAFRGRTADVLLPPTRALARAKRSLSALPGGGGTPVALGLDAALTLALDVRRRGRVAQIVLMTDGRANVTRDGKAGRPKAQADATDAARRVRAAAIRTVLIDTSARPEPLAAKLAADLAALYLPLPYADAAKITQAVKGAGAAGRVGVRA